MFSAQHAQHLTDAVLILLSPGRFSAANFGAKVAIIELPFAFIPDEKHGGAGGT